MFTLLLPVAGRSSRFPNMRPKWLLTMPDGKLMIEKSLEKIDLKAFDRVVIICLKEHVDMYVDIDLLRKSIEGKLDRQVEFVVLSEATSSQSETIAKGLRFSNTEGAFFIKDCDNMFRLSPQPKNQIATIDLHEIDLVDAKNKSYVEYDSIGVIKNIIEKKVISDSFCCGGYSFESSKEFLDSYDSITKEGEIYISHVIYKMLLDGVVFENAPSSEYIDWGTLREYRHYCKSYLTVFCDVDGVLLKNGSKFQVDGWNTPVLDRNIEVLVKMQKKGLLFLVLTSSRPEAEIPSTLEKLEEKGLYVDKVLFGLPHTKRVLINDYSHTNPYPSSIAINLERDNENLNAYFE